MKRNVRFLVALAVAVAVALAVWLRAPPRVEGFDNDDEATIFISIASYRDADCSTTLADAFAKAARPERIFVGVCEQNTSGAAEVCLTPEFEWHDHVRRVSVPAREAKGPTFARYLCSTLFRNETYFCQVDSHTRFTQDWDARVIAMLKACPSAKPVLSHYPHDWAESRKPGGGQGVPVLCKSLFDSSGLPTFNAVTLAASDTPRPVPFTSGGFVFGPGSMLREVPYDPNLPHLFVGEEITYSARLWTSGYDIFTPTDNLVYHHYMRSEAPKFWNDIDYTAEQRATNDKVKKLLTGQLPDYQYGMGGERSLDEYWAYAGIDWANKTSTSEQKFCGA